MTRLQFLKFAAVAPAALVVSILPTRRPDNLLPTDPDKIQEMATGHSEDHKRISRLLREIVK
jgi:hypothetical protein